MKKSDAIPIIPTVAAPDDDRLPTAWLFTRGEASVHMEVIERSRGLHLTVRGPGFASAAHDFADRHALLAFTRAQELELRAAGFHLQAVAERRSGEDRRDGSREGGSGSRRR